MRFLRPGGFRGWIVGFCGGRKPVETGETGDTPSEPAENRQQTRPTYGHTDGWRASSSSTQSYHHCAIPTTRLFFAAQL